MMKEYTKPDAEVLELYLDSGCLINESLLGDDSTPDMGVEDVPDPFNMLLL